MEKKVFFNTMEKKIFSTNGNGTIKHPHAKKRGENLDTDLTTFSKTQNGLQILI